MTIATYTYQRGETIKVALDAVVGDPLTAVDVSAKMRKLASGSRVLVHSAAEAADLVVSTRSAVGDIPAGWTFTLSATLSGALDAGLYLLDARITVPGGDVETTESVVIQITEPATLS